MRFAIGWKYTAFATAVLMGGSLCIWNIPAGAHLAGALMGYATGLAAMTGNMYRDNSRLVVGHPEAERIAS